MKLKLENVTLVSVTSVKIPETIKALKKSCLDINFGDVKLITDGIVNPDGFKVEKIDPLDYDGYSKFIVFDLHKFIDTEFALIVQHDGFVTNAEKWKPEFLDYDYIGAPFALPSDSFSMRDRSGKIFRVGNGGFSLRTKKLLSIADQKKLKWEPFHGFWHEDGFFCANNRHIYENEGCKFAPLEVAVHFSHEAKIPETEGITPFGFHKKGYVHID